MTHKEQTEAALRTEPDYEGYEEVYNRVNIPLLRLLHVAMGLCTETGEFQDQLKRHLFYGKPLDLVNLREEAGDVTWYLRILADCTRSLAQGDSFESIIDTNIAKLKARFPQKFSEDKALNRDLEAERKVLEQK